MKGSTKLWLLGGAVLLLASVIVLEATPGSVLTERTASGSLSHKEYLIAFVGLILLAFMALGLDVRDWL